jgi:hypothetical protein
MNRKLLTHLRARQEAVTARASSLFGVDVSGSRAGRVGQALVTVAALVELATPVLVFGGIFALTAVETVAQTVPGGNIFGNSAETPGRGLVEAVKYARNVVFVAGIAFFIWAAINMGFEKPWGGKAWAGAACWGFSGIAALVYEFSQGNAVNLDTSGLGR